MQMKHSDSGKETATAWRDTSLCTLHYADDQIIIGQDKEDLEYMGKKLLEEYQKMESINKF